MMRHGIDELSRTDGLQPLTDVAAVDALLSESRQRPAVLFKHSPTCGISAHVHHKLMPLIHDAELEADWYLISVRAHRDVSDSIAARLKVWHASPQVIVLRNGAVIWHGSHFGISERSVLRALSLR
jgi:bacillithiol system protein YtxJ